MKAVRNQKLWNSELGNQGSMNVLKRIIVGFQQGDRQNSQILRNDTFCRLPISGAQCIITTEIYPVVGILMKYDDDDYTQG